MGPQVRAPQVPTNRAVVSVGRGWSPILEGKPRGGSEGVPATCLSTARGDGDRDSAASGTRAFPKSPWSQGQVHLTPRFWGTTASGQAAPTGEGTGGGTHGIPSIPGGGPAVFTELNPPRSPARPRRTIACGRGDTGRPHTTLEDRGPCHPPPAPGLIMIM